MKNIRKYKKSKLVRIFIDSKRPKEETYKIEKRVEKKWRDTKQLF